MPLTFTPGLHAAHGLAIRANDARSAAVHARVVRAARTVALLAMLVVQGGCSGAGEVGPPPPSLASGVQVADAPASARPGSDPAADAAHAGGDGPSDADVAKARASFEVVSKALGRPGVYRTPGVYVVTVPRDDLMLSIEGMEVPTAAGIESVFHFYYCPCGKTNVVGQVCVLDYEQNDVIDALRAGKIEVVSTAPMLLHARNAPIAVRFFAEGKPDVIGAALRQALRWTGKERMAPAAP